MEFKFNERYQRMFEVDKYQSYYNNAAKIIKEIKDNPIYTDKLNSFISDVEKDVKKGMRDNNIMSAEDVKNFTQAIQEYANSELSKTPDKKSVLVAMMLVISYNLKTIENAPEPTETLATEQ